MTLYFDNNIERDKVTLFNYFFCITKNKKKQSTNQQIK